MGRGLRALLALAVVAALGGADWTRFRGPDGTGIAADKDIPVQWTEKEGLRWKVAIPGVGNSCPIVLGNKVFLQTSLAEERLLLCLNAEDGKTLWTQSVPGVKAHIHELNSLASSTPTTDGEKVYALFWNGKTIVMHAFDLMGKPIWQQDLGEFNSQHGVGASPVVYGGLVYLNKDQDKKAALIALRAKDGKIAWQVPREAFRACYSTPFILKEGDKAELIVTSTAGIAGYDPATGEEKWTWTWAFDGMALRTVASSIYHNGIVFATSGDGRGDRHAVAVKKGEKGDVTRTNRLWENKKTLPYVPTMLAQGEHIYFVNDSGMAGCTEASTGKSIWFERLTPAKVLASPVLIDGKIYAVSEKGDVHVFAADTTLRRLGKSTVGEPVIASPAVANGKLYIRGSEHLFCIGKASSK